MKDVFLVSANIPLASMCHTLLRKNDFRISAILRSERFPASIAALHSLCPCCLDIELPAPFLHTIVEAFLNDPTLSGRLPLILIRSDATRLAPYERQFIAQHTFPFFLLPQQEDAFLTYLVSLTPLSPSRLP